jgi:predicted aspartyl protease
MGTFTYPLRLISLAGLHTEIEALVDTGSTFTSIERPLLERLGVAPIARIRVRLANGELEETDVGELVAQIDDFAPRTIICAFSPTGAPAILGAHTLEAFLLGVDPLGHKLVPVEALWAHQRILQGNSYRRPERSATP